ncbi:LysR family transcriptional regulator [Halomonas sp. MCCC 1A17488]|uniref:LysR family transcriptional regulator n=1 Tax=unclassified Halomonas TaxID=2609666 RepID=UPI0018D20C1A|nr:MULTISPECIES: LysR family transcriptional regulator [unclassified Halomonas]MCE8016070.1 LysR family transcriptional regulator [Halomonas sp. MCCC 1A17488]MCG3239403.1 LysR family transcriptional regulator [Halomonas sp. MCCC 1A17488]QPP50667.1 LysR family transcriptional regulator [Halomonas sp. SS10-MC5]
MRTLGDDWFLQARLKLRHLQLFLALDEQRNLHRAAAQLGISQPAASKLLGDVESQLGVKLFDRHPRGLEPNWYGEVMVRHAQAMLSELHNTGEELNALFEGNAGKVAIGTVMAPAVTLLASAIERVHRSHPRLKVSVEVDVSKRLVPRLLEGELDFAITRIPAGFSSEPFVFEEIGEEEICFVCREGHPLSGADPLTLAAMAAYPWALQPQGALMRQRVDALFLHYAVEPPAQVVDTTDILVALALIDRSDTITATTRQVADLLCAPTRFRILPFHQRLSVQPFGLVSLRRRRPSPGAATLMGMVRELVAHQRQQGLI